MFIWLPPTEAPDSRETPDKEPETPHSAPAKIVPELARLAGSAPDPALRDFAGLPLRWVELQAGIFERTYGLRCGQDVLALMRYEKTFLPTRRGLAETTEGSWSFRQHWGNVVIIDGFEGDCKLGTLECQRLGKRMLSLPKADNYFWEGGRGFGRVDGHWLTADGAPLVSFKAKYGLLTLLSWGTEMVGEVKVQAPAAALPELGLLLTLGWYLVVLEIDPLGGGGGGG